jgi:very-short-patch-repair endonuclease
MKYSNRPLSQNEYVHIGENYYALRSEWDALSERERHLSVCFFIMSRRSVPMIFTGKSACAARNIPRLDALEMRPHCISQHRRSDDWIRWHYGSSDENASVIRSLLIASPPRIICDLAGEDSPESLLVSINHCLYKKLFRKEDLLAEMEKHPGLRGAKILRRLLYFATDRCESPLETLAWIALYKAKFVMPAQQLRFYASNKIVGQVDMYWELPRRTVILELDGKLKYQNEDAIYKEKRREDALRAMGHEVIRAGWIDVMNGTLTQRLREEKIPQRKYYGRKLPAARNPLPLSTKEPD